MILTVRSQVKSNAKLDSIKQNNIPIHVIQENDAKHIRRFFRDYFNLEVDDKEVEKEALNEIYELIKKVQNTNHSQDAEPRNDYLRRIQHQAAQETGFNSMSVGKDPNRRVRIYPANKP